MRQILVQNSATKLFLTPRDAWTSSQGEARDFETSVNAFAYCLHKKLRETQIVVRFNRPEAPDLILPVMGKEHAAGNV
jgi:hypothetical protein